MRFAVRVLAGVGAGAVSLALADPSTTAPDTTTAPAAATAPAATATTPGAQASPAPSATATSAATAPAKPAIDPEEKRLIAMGYKPEMRNGEKVFCRHEQTLGSRLAEAKYCASAEQLKISQQENQDVIEKIQRTQKNPSGG
jgi:hypothetical protein